MSDKKNFGFGTQIRKSPYFDSTVKWGPPTKFETEKQSEYHVKNLKLNKIHKDYLQEWSNVQVKQHMKFEEDLRIKTKRRLNFSK